MLGKKFQAARPGGIGAGLVVAGALVTMETVLRARIDKNLDLRPLGLDGFDVAQGNASNLFAEVQFGRTFWFVGGKADDYPAVVANCRRQARQFGRGRIGDTAAEAEA